MSSHFHNFFKSTRNGATTVNLKSSNTAHTPGHDGKNFFALIVGIDHYGSPEICDLNGAVADATAFRQFLCKRLGVPSRNIVFLDDGEDKQTRKDFVKGTATRERIISNFQSHLIKNKSIPETGAAIIFHFAGHGTRITAPSEVLLGGDGKVEGICPLDERTGSPGKNYVYTIPLFTFGRLLHDLTVAKGSNITIILDCCHSGAGAGDGGVSRAAPHDPNELPLDLDNELWPKHEWRDSTVLTYTKWAPLSRSYVLLAACKASQTATENIMTGGPGRGRFSQKLLARLNQVDLNNTTAAELIAPFAADWPDQTPQCSGNKHYLLFTTEYSKHGRNAISLESIPCFRVNSGLNAGLFLNAKCRVQNPSNAIFKDIQLKVFSVANDDALLTFERKRTPEDLNRCSAIWKCLQFSDKSDPHAVSLRETTTGGWGLRLGRGSGVTIGMGFSIFSGNECCSTLLVEEVDNDNVSLVLPHDQCADEADIPSVSYVTVSNRILRLEPESRCFRIEMGEASGICPLTEFTAFDENNNERGTLVVHSTTPSHSILTSKHSDGLDIPLHSRVKISKWNIDAMSLRIYLEGAFPAGYAEAIFEKESNTRLKRTSEKRDAKIVLRSVGNEVRIEWHKSIRKGFPNFPLHSRFKFEPSRKDLSPLPRILDGIAHFSYFLERKNSGSPIHMDEVVLKMHRLKGRAPYREPDLQYGIAGNVLGEEHLTLVTDATAKYGFTIVNKSNHDLFPYLFYFNPLTYSIERWYSPPCTDVPLPGCPESGQPREVTVGMGGQSAVNFVLPHGVDLSCGFFQLIVSTEHLDLSWMEQQSPMDPEFQGNGRAHAKREVLRPQNGWNLLTAGFTLKRRA